MYFRKSLRSIVLGKVFKKKTNNETDFDWINQKGIYWSPEDFMESKTGRVSLEHQEKAGML